MATIIDDLLGQFEEYRSAWFDAVGEQAYHGRATGRDLIAVDSVGAGETMLIRDEGNGARQVLQAPDAPVRALVVGIVDEFETIG